MFGTEEKTAKNKLTRGNFSNHVNQLVTVHSSQGKTHKELPFSRQRMKTHKELPLFVEKPKSQFGIWKKPKFQNNASQRTMREKKKKFSFEWIQTPRYGKPREMNTQRKDLSTRKGTIINPGLIWNKTCIFLPTCYGSPLMKEKKEENKLHQTLIGEHTI